MNISKKERNDQIIETAKERINAGVSTNTALSTLLQEYPITLGYARKLYRKAKKEVGKNILSTQIASLAIEFVTLEKLQEELIEYTNEEHVITDKFGMEQEKDISRYYALRLSTIAEKIKLINILAPLQEEIMEIEAHNKAIKNNSVHNNGSLPLYRNNSQRKTGRNRIIELEQPVDQDLSTFTNEQLIERSKLIE